MPTDYQRRLGDRLRAIRQQQGLTLQQVEERSSGEWKAVVVGSYERGDRAVSVAKLAELARFYGVPVGELLPVDERDAAAADIDEKVTLDLTRFTADSPVAFTPLHRYVQTIQVQRGDFNGRMITLRKDDLRAIAIVMDRDADEMIDDLERQGLLA